MPYQPRPDDIGFLLFDVLQAPQALSVLPGLTEADAPLMAQVLEEAGKFVAEVIAPLNKVGDEVGCRFEAGQVTTPPGFADAYRAFWQAGWPALSAAVEDGGQGLPRVLETVLYEWLRAANHGWTMAPGLLHGAYECLKHHGHPLLQAAYLDKLATGEWLPTMCLTEPQAGSDVGLVRTQAVPVAEGGLLPGEHSLSGTKIFISSGEHDLSENIVHLVLARLPGAAPGPKGLSLFLVPKFLPSSTEPGAPLGPRNGVFCERIEEKMGLHASPTCVMRFENAAGWLIGQPGAGLNAMFIMMNAARLEVALEGVALLDAAWQQADAYARERRQMRAPGPRPASRGPHDSADLLIEHPAMRRILDVQRAWIDGGRVLGYHTSLQLDVARLHPDPERRAQAQRWCGLITPVLKAAWTQQGFEGASACLQVFGGHGYVREWGIEQTVRDARVAMIYEGTNEIQAIDLLTRKVLPDAGAGLAQVLATLQTSLDATHPRHATLLAHGAELQALTTSLLQASVADAELPFRVADDYLHAVALVLLGWAWTRIEATPGADQPRWQAPAQAFWDRVLPEFTLRVQLVRNQLR